MSRVRRLSSLKFLFVTVAVCGGVAFSLSLVCRDHAIKAAVPVVFLLALVPAAHVSGRTGSLVVAIVASLIFAVYLFEPYGSLAIRSAADQTELFCFVLAAIGVVRFSPNVQKFAKAALQSSPEHIPVSSLSAGRGELLESWIAIMGYAIVLMAIVTVLVHMWN